MRPRPRNILLALAVCLLLTFALHAQDKPPAKPRARGLGVPFDGLPGPLNAITDVSGVIVGHTTLISGEGKLQVGKGPVRTGVTAVLPRGKDSMNNPVFAGWWSLNGNGEMTGTTWVEESGFLEGPVMITNTHSVGVVRDAVIQWRVAHGQPDPTGYWWSLPVVAETWDGWLNDINGFHVNPSMRSTPSIPHTAAPSKKATLAAAREWSATNSRAASARLREKSNRKSAPTPSACLCNATMARAKISVSLVCPSAGKFPKIPRTLPHHSANWTAAPSSSSSLPMRRSSRISPSASLAASRSASVATAASPATVPAIFSSLSPPPTPAPPLPTMPSI